MQLIAAAHQAVWHHNPIGLALIAAAAVLAITGVTLMRRDAPGYWTPGASAGPGAPLFVIAFTLAVVGSYFLTR